MIINNDIDAEKEVMRYKKAKEENDRLRQICYDMSNEYLFKGQQYEQKNKDLLQELNYALEQYMLTVEVKETKTQFSYKLPSAKLTFKKDAEKIKKLDNLIEYVGEEYKKIKVEVDWARLKEDLEIKENVIINKETGEVMQGVEIESVKGTFNLKLEG